MTRPYMGNFNMRMNSDRELKLERAKEALGIDNDTQAVVAALEHLAQSKAAYEDIKDEITPEQARTLSTDVVAINHYPQVRT